MENRMRDFKRLLLIISVALMVASCGSSAEESEEISGLKAPAQIKIL
tara:strand:- start:209 stop:349 length:141 start_codon:yes stop_codon:yes gene_type:complete